MSSDKIREIASSLDDKEAIDFFRHYYTDVSDKMIELRNVLSDKVDKIEGILGGNDFLKPIGDQEKILRDVLKNLGGVQKHIRAASKENYKNAKLTSQLTKIQQTGQK